MNLFTGCGLTRLEKDNLLAELGKALVAYQEVGKSWGLWDELDELQDDVYLADQELK
jgi:hypothetical protein